MELKIYNPTDDGFVKVIDWNHEEIKKEVSEKVAYYKNLVYTDEQIKDAKADRAKLNKFLTALEDKRKEIKKQCLAPYESFEKQMKEITSIVQESIVAIGTQVLEYEEKQKREKKDSIENFFDSCLHPEWLKFEQIFNEKWLNASVSMKSIQGEIDSRLEQIANDIATLQNLPEFGFEAMTVYKSTLDINKALNEGRRLSEIAKAKAAHEAEMKARAEEKALLEAEKARLDAEAEAKRHIEEFENDMSAQNEAILKGCEMAAKAPAKQWVTFAAHLTTEDALALKAFFESRNIEFKAV